MTSNISILFPSYRPNNFRFPIWGNYCGKDRFVQIRVRISIAYGINYLIHCMETLSNTFDLLWIAINELWTNSQTLATINIGCRRSAGWQDRLYSKSTTSLLFLVVIENYSLILLIFIGRWVSINVVDIPICLLYAIDKSMA